MKIQELAEAAARKTKTDTRKAQAVLISAFQAIGNEIQQNERAAVQALGTFQRRASKSGVERILFKPISPSAEKQPAKTVAHRAPQAAPPRPAKTKLQPAAKKAASPPKRAKR